MNLDISNPSVPKGTTELPRERLDAKMLGYTKYYTGKPCRAGHITPRYVANGMCAGCASVRSKRMYTAGKRQVYQDRPAINRKWNASDTAKRAKAAWKARDPKRAWAVYAVGGAKARANLNSLPFSLSFKYILSIAPDVCPVFGTPFSFGGGPVSPESASLDRLDPVKGYVEGNVVVISLKANAIKNAYRSADILKVGEWVRAQGF